MKFEELHPMVRKYLGEEEHESNYTQDAGVIDVMT